MGIETFEVANYNAKYKGTLRSIICDDQHDLIIKQFIAISKGIDQFDIESYFYTKEKKKKLSKNSLSSIRTNRNYSNFAVCKFFNKLNTFF